MIQFSSEQIRVIEHWGSGMAVLAGAGSGKTTTLVSKCLRLLEKDPTARLIAVSFTERSAGDLRAKLSKAFLKKGQPGALGHHWVTTIHGLCGSVIREFPVEAGFDGEESILSESDSTILWERALDYLWYEEEFPLEAELERLLSRETRASLMTLLVRVRELESFGGLKFLEGTNDPDSVALAQLSAYLIEKYRSLKQRRGAVDFSDLEKGADRALDHAYVRQAYQKRFQLLLIDEFQDTNPVQARILWRMAKPDLSNICVVGDPKQSIYRFRDADVSVFQEYCEKLPAHFSLTWNFRSRPEIIHYVNEVCEKAFQNSEIPFEALIPQRESALPLGPGQAVLRLDLSEPAELARWILEEVKKGVPLDEMALLVRRIRGNERWIKALESYAIPVAIGSGGLFWEAPEIRELVAFLGWWNNPSNTFSGAVFLRAPWVRDLNRGDSTDITDLKMDLWNQRDPTWRVPFLESGHPLAEVLKGLTNSCVRPGELLLAFLELQPKIGTSILGLWHRVEEFSSSGMDFHQVVRELNQAISEKRRERSLPAPKNEGSLTVLTLHGSKGLEFKNVILIDFGKKNRASDAPMLFWDRQKGAYFAKRDLAGQREKKNPTENSWRELEKWKNLAESKRLFYVGLTRAQERLVLVCPELEDVFETTSREKVFLEDYWRGWIEVAGGAAKRVPKVEVDEGRERISVLGSNPDQGLCKGLAQPKKFENQGPNLMRARHSVTEWVLLSRCPRAYEWKFLRPPKPLEQGPTQELPQLGSNSISSSEIGSRIHKILETGDLEKLYQLEEEIGAARFVALPVVQWATQNQWIFKKSGSDANPSSVFSELSFEVPVGEKDVLVGIIDRLVWIPLQEGLEGLKGGEGYRAELVDFKFSDHPQSSRSLLESYRVQMDLYSEALTLLQPGLQKKQIRASLVSISSRGVRMIQVPLGQDRVREKLLAHAQSLIRGSFGGAEKAKRGKETLGLAGVASPGSRCRYCEFLSICSEGQKAAEPQDSQLQLI